MSHQKNHKKRIEKSSKILNLGIAVSNGTESLKTIMIIGNNDNSENHNIEIDLYPTPTIVDVQELIQENNIEEESIYGLSIFDTKEEETDVSTLTLYHLNNLFEEEEEEEDFKDQLNMLPNSGIPLLELFSSETYKTTDILNTDYDYFIENIAL